MAKPELGKKHNCHSCGANYYDLNAEKVVCPKCGKAPKKAKAHFTPEEKLDVAEDTSAAAEVDANGNELESLEELVEEESLNEDELEDDEENGLIADASDLGEDDDDLSEVMEHIDEDIVDRGD